MLNKMEKRAFELTRKRRLVLGREEKREKLSQVGFTVGIEGLSVRYLTFSNRHLI